MRNLLNQYLFYFLQEMNFINAMKSNGLSAFHYRPTRGYNWISRVYLLQKTKSYNSSAVGRS